jgi:hypothetical protein
MKRAKIGIWPLFDLLKIDIITAALWFLGSGGRPGGAIRIIRRGGAAHLFLHLPETLFDPPRGAVQREDEFKHEVIRQVEEKSVKKKT